VVKTLVVVEICPAREQVPDAVCHSGKKIMGAAVRNMSIHWCDLRLGHVFVRDRVLHRKYNVFS
jgi:hypothetical protein